MNKFLTIITLIIFSLNLCKSQNLELTLKQSFERAENLNLPLLIVRYHQAMVDYPKTYNTPTSDSILDSIMAESKNKSILETEYVVYKLDIDSSNEDDIAFQKQFILDYTPNFVLYTSKGELIHFYNPISYESENDSIIEDLRDTIKVNSKLLLTRLSLEKKFLEKSIDTKELYELIKIRHSVHLKTKAEINEYVRLGNSIDLNLMEIVNQQTFKISDPIAKYFMGMDENDSLYNPFNQLAFFENILNNSRNELNDGEFKETQKWKVYFEKKVVQIMNDEFPEGNFHDISVNNTAILQNDLMDQFSFYASNNDLINIIKVGNELTNNLLSGYESNKKEYVENELAKGDFLMKGLIELNPTLDSSVLNNIEYRVQNRDQVILKYGNQFDEVIANDLNAVSWTFYEKVTETSEIKKALNWSKKSVELNLTAANMDTYAHLLFKLGHKKKAIKYEQKALELAISEGNARYVEEFKQEILKFKSNPSTNKP